MSELKKLNFTEIERIKLITPYINQQLKQLLIEHKETNILGLLINIFQNNSRALIYSTLTKYQYVDVKELSQITHLSESTVSRTLNYFKLLGIIESFETYYWKYKNKKLWRLMLHE